MAVGGTGAAVYLQQRQAQAARLAVALREVELLRDQARSDPDGDPARWHAAVAAAERAADLLGPMIDAPRRREVQDLQGRGEAGGPQRRGRRRSCSAAWSISARPRPTTPTARPATRPMPPPSATPGWTSTPWAPTPSGRGSAPGRRAWRWPWPRPWTTGPAGGARPGPGTRRPGAGSVAAARAADPDPTRDRLRALWRDPTARRRAAALLELANQADPKGWPPASLILLAGGSILCRRARRRRSALLRRAQAHQPGDVWLSYNLAA